MRRTQSQVFLALAALLGSLGDLGCTGPELDAVSGGPPSGASSGTTEGPPTTQPPTPTEPGSPATTSPSTTSTAATSTEATSTEATSAEATSATSPDLPAASTGDGPGPSCGDGRLDPGETCDLGLAMNSDAGACPLDCQAATCGDGKLWEGKEQCDDGPNNNDKLYGGCQTNCTLGPRCGDASLQTPEECDPGGPLDGEALPSGVVCTGCRFKARIVFLSSEAYTGAELGGLAGADLKCQALAGASAVDNAANFMAWLSSGQASPAGRFAHGPETQGVPYVLRSGVVVAKDFDDLVKNGASEGITLTETGETALDVRVWTNTDAKGEIFDPDQDCEGWTSDSFLSKTRVGRSGVDKALFLDWGTWHDTRQWTNYVSFQCKLPLRLYCFEQ